MARMVLVGSICYKVSAATHAQYVALLVSYGPQGLDRDKYCAVTTYRNPGNFRLIKTAQK